MSTKVRFGNRMIQLPGTYSRIISGQNNPPRELDYGKLLIIDNDVYGLGSPHVGMLGGAGVNGQLATGKDTVYHMKDITEFRSFVGNNWWWKAAEGLFNPDGKGQGVSEVMVIKPATTTCANMTFEAVGDGSQGGKFKFKTRDESYQANGTCDEVRATATVTITNKGTTGDVITASAGDLVLGSYTVKSTDNTAIKVAEGLALAIIAAGVAEVISYSGSATIILYAPAGLGGSINGKQVILTINSGSTIAATLTPFAGGVDEVLAEALVEISAAGSAGDVITLTVDGTLMGTVTVSNTYTIQDVLDELYYSVNTTIGICSAYGKTATTFILQAPVGSGSTLNNFTPVIEIIEGDTLAIPPADFSSGVTEIKATASVTVTAAADSGVPAECSIYVNGVMVAAYATDDNDTIAIIVSALADSMTDVSLCDVISHDATTIEFRAPAGYGDTLNSSYPDWNGTENITMSAIAFSGGVTETAAYVTIAPSLAGAVGDYVSIEVEGQIAAEYTVQYGDTALEVVDGLYASVAAKAVCTQKEDLGNTFTMWYPANHGANANGNSPIITIVPNEVVAGAAEAFTGGIDLEKATATATITLLGGVGDKIDIKVGGSIIATYTVLAGNTITNVIAGLIISMNNYNTYHAVSSTLTSITFKPVASQGATINGTLPTYVATPNPTVLYTASNFINGLDGAHLYSGYAYTIETGVIDLSKWIMKIWFGTFKGLYPVDNLPYDEVLQINAKPDAVAQSVEFDNVQTLIDWALQDSSFGKLFEIDDSSVVTGAGNVSATDILPFTGYRAAVGGSCIYDSLDDALVAVKDLNYNYVYMTCATSNPTLDTDILKVQDHIANEAKYRNFMAISGHETNLDSSIQWATTFDSEKINLVHGGIKKKSRIAASGMRTWGPMFHTAYFLGRLLGMAPWVPLTFKAFDIDGVTDMLNDKEQLRADSAGVVCTIYDADFGKFINLHDVNTLQNNDYVLNNDGSSHLIQVMRIESQLDRELVINAKIDLLSDPNGVTRSSLTKEDAIEWTKGYLQRRLKTLIVDYRNVTAYYNEDAIYVDYEASPNTEVKAIFFTGRLYL